MEMLDLPIRILLFDIYLLVRMKLPSSHLHECWQERREMDNPRLQPVGCLKENSSNTYDTLRTFSAPISVATMPQSPTPVSQECERVLSQTMLDNNHTCTKFKYRLTEYTPLRILILTDQLRKFDACVP